VAGNRGGNIVGPTVQLNSSESLTTRANALVQAGTNLFGMALSTDQPASERDIQKLGFMTPFKYQQMLGRTFVDSDDDEEELTIVGVTNGTVVTTGGIHKEWDMKYVNKKLGAGPNTAATTTATETARDRFNEATGETPEEALTVLLCAYADRVKSIAQGTPGERDVLPLNAEQRDAIKASMKTLADRVVDCAVEKSTLVHDERNLRYWFTHCDLLGIPRVMRTVEDANNLAEIAGLLGMGWSVGGKNARRGLAPNTVGGIVSSIRSWHAVKHGVDVKSLEFRATRVCKGLKKLRGPQLPQLRLSKKCYKYIVQQLRQSGNPKSLAIADAITWCYEALFRISEIADTQGHNKASGTERYLMHEDTSSIKANNGRPRKLNWTLRNTKQKELVQNRSLWAEGTKEDPAHDEVASSGDFVLWMSDRLDRNEEFLLEHPERRETLPFVHFNGEPVKSDDVKRAIESGVAACFAKGWCPDPARVRIGTHTCRRGGATLYYENGISDKSIMWLGRWTSLAWLTYPEMTDKAARRMSGLVTW